MARSRAVGKAIRIVSGGQTGVDRASLAWVVRRGLPYEGWCPKGRRAEAGVFGISPQKGSIQNFESTRAQSRGAFRAEGAAQSTEGKESHLADVTACAADWSGVGGPTRERKQ